MSEQLIPPGSSRYLTLVDEADHLRPTTRNQYRKALARYLATGHKLGDADAIAAHARELSQSSRAFLKAAIRLVTEQMALKAKSEATPDNIDSIQATLYRIEAIQQAVKVRQTTGNKAHTWLTMVQLKRLMATCDDTRPGLRDRVVMALLAGAGLRRDELAALDYEAIVEQPTRRRQRTVLDVQGKGVKDRVVPISDALADLLTRWGEYVGHEGRVARSIDRHGNIGETISPVGIFKIVRAHGEMIGKPELAPHDLRRTYAQMGFDAGTPITQISRLLGHSSVNTTQRYLNLELDLDTTVSDFIPV